MRTIKIPEEYQCSITQEIMQEPVSTRDGYTYEKSAIEKWLLSHNTSPLTNKRLIDKTLIPNLFAKQQITKFLEMNNIIPYEAFIAAVNDSSIEALANINILDTYLERLDEAGLAPIHKAVQNGCVEVVKWLLEAGTDIEMRDNGGDHKGNTPLIWAACKNHFNVAEFLLDCGAKIDNSDNARWTALHWILSTIKNHASSGHLLQKSANLDPIEDVKFYYLEEITEANALVKLLLAKKAQVNVKNGEGNTGLHILVNVYYNNVQYNNESIKILLDYGASFNIVNNAGETALQIAQKKNPNLAKFMQNYKEEVKQKKWEKYINIAQSNEQQADTIKRLQIENESLQQRVKSLEDKMDTVMRVIHTQDKEQARFSSNRSSLDFFK